MNPDDKRAFRAAFSVKVWGVYLVLAGVGLLSIPNIVLPVLGFSTTTEVWVRVLGLAVAVLGGYYFHLARNNVIAFVQATIPGRLIFAIGTVALVATGMSGASLLLFGITDAAGAIWTWWALRRSA